MFLGYIYTYVPTKRYFRWVGMLSAKQLVMVSPWEKCHNLVGLRAENQIISSGCRYPELQVLESWDMASVCVCVHIQIQSPLAFFVHTLRYVVWLFAFVEFRMI